LPQPPRVSPAALVCLALLAALPPQLAAADGGDAPLGRAAFANRRAPPAWRELPSARREHFDLGLLIFNTSWVIAGTSNAARIDGLGPLFVGSSCDTCHNNGARGRPAAGPAGTSSSSVMQLAGAGEQIYGAVLNTAAIAGHAPEGQVQVEWLHREGRYADGGSWALREPRYTLRNLIYGPPGAGTVLRPRIGPQVFGTGLLEQVALQALEDIQGRQPRALRGELPPGRFGWQGEALDVEHQTALALAREMGLSSNRIAQDDCSATQIACRAEAQGGAPEVSDEFMRALVTYQQELAVPARVPLPAEREANGGRLFERTGCATCHQPSLPVSIDDTDGRIDAFTDLLLHDLGEGLADRNLAGRPVPSRWRTAPLWGMAHAGQFGDIALLHDGRAASVEEAILWHGGQAEEARSAFLHLPAGDRQTLIAWVESL